MILVINTCSNPKGHLPVVINGVNMCYHCSKLLTKDEIDRWKSLNKHLDAR